MGRVLLCLLRGMRALALVTGALCFVLLLLHDLLAGRGLLLAELGTHLVHDVRGQRAHVVLHFDAQLLRQLLDDFARHAEVLGDLVDAFLRRLRVSRHAALLPRHPAPLRRPQGRRQIPSRG
jgi:hypothetical protein